MYYYTLFDVLVYHTCMHTRTYVCTGCLSFLCPCYLSGLIAETTSRNCLLYTLLSSLPCLNVFVEYLVRDDIRVTKGIQVRTYVCTTKDC